VSNPVLAAGLDAAVNTLLNLDSERIRAHARPNLLALEQSGPLAALTALLPEVRTAAQAAGFPALEAEHRCDALRAACVEEQLRATNYLGAEWRFASGHPVGKPEARLETEGYTGRWVKAFLGVRSALDRVMSMLAVEATPALAGAERRQEDAPPADDSAFRPANRLLDSTRFTHFKRLHAALKANPWIRTRKPSRQRLEVHAGDWDRYLAMLDAAGFDALDVAAETAVAFMAEAHRRQDEIRSRKAGK
jgi:hypothetical protein